MNNHTQDDKLVALPPRDLILSLRRDALEKAENERIKHKIKKAGETYSSLLEEFADNFFRDDKIYGGLKPNEKKELEKFCASYCRKQIILKTLPFAVIAGIITGLGVWNPFTLIISSISLTLLFLFGGMLFATSGW